MHEGICHVNESTNDMERDSSTEKTRLRWLVETRFIKEMSLNIGRGLKYQTTQLHKDVQFSSVRSQNYYCLADVVCVNKNKS